MAQGAGLRGAPNAKVKTKAPRAPWEQAATRRGRQEMGIVVWIIIILIIAALIKYLLTDSKK